MGQREAWQKQIDQVNQREETLNQKTVLASKDIEQDRGNIRVELFEIIELHGIQSEDVKKFEILEPKEDELKMNLDKGNDEKKDVIVVYSKTIKEEKSKPTKNSLNRKSSYIEEAKRFLDQFRQGHQTKNIQPASPKEKNVVKEKNSLTKAQNANSSAKVTTEKLDQSQIKDILIGSINSKEGLKEIIKKLMKEKLKDEHFLAV